MAKILTRNLGLKCGAETGLIRICESYPTGPANDIFFCVVEQKVRIVRLDCVWLSGTPAATIMPRKCTNSTTLELPSASSKHLLQSAWNLAASAAVLRSSDPAPTGVTIVSHPLSLTEADLILNPGDGIGLDESASAAAALGLTITALLLPLPNKLYWFTGV